MSSVLRGVSVVLYERTAAGRDELNREIFTETPVTVENVLIAPVESSAGDGGESTDLARKRVRYQLAIPKGDAHEWEDRRVEFFGRMWRTVSRSTVGIEVLIPLDWNRKVMVEPDEQAV